MLDCKKDRLDYGDQLRPPAGYQFDRAIGATYSANLDTVLSLPVALVFGHTLEGDLSGERVELLEAIRNFSSRVRIFHQKGQIHVPKRSNWLYAYLEDALIEILPGSEFSSFHPKVWVIRYVLAEDEQSSVGPQSKNLAKVHYRLLVLSRNLTFDRSWDIAACLDGTVGKSRDKLNDPLADFLKWLSKNEAKEIGWVNKMISEIPFVNFETPPIFDSHRFHPLGIPEHTDWPMAEIKARRSLVMSPFIDEKVIQRLRDQTKGDVLVFGEAFELNRFEEEIRDEVEPYVLSEHIVDGEYNADREENSLDEQRQNLHAKLFVFREDKQMRWFFGSANATEAARKRNVEFMLELTGSSGKVSINCLKRNLLGEDGNWPFLRHEYSNEVVNDDEAASMTQAARCFEYALLKSEIEAKLDRSDEAKNWDLVICFHLGQVAKNKDLRVTVAPFNLKDPADPVELSPGNEVEQEIVFQNVGEIELSRFLIFRIERLSDKQLLHEFLLRIEIANLPKNRLRNILRKVIDSPEKFFRYLRFLLEEEVPKEALTGTESGIVFPTDGDESNFSEWMAGVPLFERLLVIASRSPSRLQELDKIIRELADESDDEVDGKIIPDAFIKFWEPFRNHIPARKISVRKEQR